MNGNGPLPLFVFPVALTTKNPSLMNWKGRYSTLTGLPRPRSRTLALGIAALALSGAMQAQVSTYSFQQVPGTYTNITGGTLLNATTGTDGVFVNGTSTPTASSFNGSNNFIKAGVGYPIGFNFTYNSAVFDRIGIAAQGWISLGNSSNGATAVYAYGGFGSTPPLSYQMPSGASPAADRFNRIAGLAISNLIPRDAAPLGELRVETIGTAPNRVCVVQWANFRTGSNADALNFQIRLNETSNTVEVVYKNPNAEWLTSGFFFSSQVGLRGATGSATGAASATDFSRVSTGSVQPYSWAPLTWPVLVNNASVASTCYVDASPANVTKPAAGTTLRWTPPTCPAPSGVKLVTAGSNSLTISWNGPSGSETYDHAVNTVNSPTTGSPITGGGASGTSLVATGLASNTVYYAFVRKNCGGGDFSAWVQVTSRIVSQAGSIVPNAIQTAASCGQAFDRSTPFVGGGGALDGVWTECAPTAADVVKVTFTSFDVQGNNSALYVHDGPSLASLLISSGQAALGAPSTVAGGYYGAANPGPFTSTVGGCLTFHYSTLFGGDSWGSDVTCFPAPTCFAPTAISMAPSTQGGTATFTGTSASYEYKLVANGALPSAPAIAQGTGAGSPLLVTGVVGGTTYTLYLRGVCSVSDISDWSSATNFTTLAGCGGPFNFTNAGASYPLDNATTICPNTPGDVVTVTSSAFSFNGFGGDVSLYVYDGPNTSSTLLSSGLAGVNGMPAGGYRINGTVPPVFTSTHAGGCLTFRFRATSQGSFTGDLLSAVTCAPAPTCATPSAVTLAQIQGTSAQVSWVGAGSTYIVEYGAPGFTAGTGATAGSGSSTVVTNVSSPYTISGLSTTTSYKVVVRKACAGPTYSANSFPTTFFTSMECATATVLACAELTTVVSVQNAQGNPAYQGAGYSAATCLGNINGATGAEKLFRITALQAGAYRLNITNNTLSGTYAQNGYLIAPASEGCGAAAFTCIGSGLSPSNGSGQSIPGFIDFNLATAGDYYVMHDSYDGSSGSQQFQVLCPGIPPCISEPTFPKNNTSFSAASTTPIAFSWPAAFGATGYDVYFQGAPVASNYASTSITGAAYTPANIAALYGIGTTITWRVVPRNASGIATCPTTWSFIVGGNGTSNAIPLTSGVVRGGTNNSTNGYTSTYSTFISGGFTGNINSDGNDVTYSYTTSVCDSIIRVQYCQLGFTGVNNPLLIVRRVADNVEVGKIIMGNVVSPNNCRTLDVVATPNTPYYVTVDAQSGVFYDFTVVLTAILTTADTDGDGLLNCADNCPETPGQVGSICYLGPLFSNATVNGDCECTGTPVACTTPLTLEFQTDANPEQTTWELYEDGTNFLVSSGGPLSASAENSIVTEFTCVPDGCYYLRVLDSAGDGMTTGGYVLRAAASNLRIIDNRNNFATGSVSGIASGNSFCVPLGAGRPIFAACDRLDWVNYNFIVATENAAVTAAYASSPTTSGYEFWFYDPNGSYSYRRFRSHSTTDGTGTGATRACHFKINKLVPVAPGNQETNKEIPYNTLLNVRIRGRANGVNQSFGPACLFKLDAARAACPFVKLQDNVLDLADFSCGVTKTFGGANSTSNKIVAAAPQFSPIVASSLVRYQFRFRNGERCIVRPPQVSATLYLNWAGADRLVCSEFYDVDVRVSKNSGATWCTGNASITQAANCANLNETWGKMCRVTITTSTNCPQTLAGGASNMVEGQGGLTMYPNPNRGDQLFISLNTVAADVNTVSVDIYDLTGKRITARTIAAQDGVLNTSLELNGELASGIYLVNITAGDKIYTERLVIQH